jgi:hypothetical protein
MHGHECSFFIVTIPQEVRYRVYKEERYVNGNGAWIRSTQRFW